MSARLWSAAGVAFTAGLAFTAACANPTDKPAGQPAGISSTSTATPEMGAATFLKNMPACQFEDGPGPCFWDAGAAGNGVGNSFWIDCHQVGHYLDPVIDAREGGENWAPNGYADTCAVAS